MIVLAITDMMALHTGAWNMWMRSVTGSYMLAGSDIGCKIYSYLRNITSSYAGWVLCVITVERIVALAVPYQVKTIFTKEHVCYILIGILLIISLIFITGWIGVISVVCSV